MNAIISAVAVLVLQSPTRPILVLVPEAADPEVCFAAERIASVMSLTRGVRLLRAKVEPGETLEAARVRLGADQAIEGLRRMKNGVETVSLFVARAGLRAPEETTSSGPPVRRTEILLASIWPKDAPPLAPVAGAAAASASALEAICKNEIEAAYSISGAAIAPAMRERLAPPPSDGRGVLLRWAKASALQRSGKTKEAIPILKSVVASLQKGESAPIWRLEAKNGDRPSAIDLFGERVVLFRNGAFTALDLGTGAELWTIALGKADPHLAWAGEDLAIAALENEIAAIDLADGRVRWRVALEKPAPEIARIGTRIFAAGSQELIAIERQRGDVVWKLDPLADLASGPRIAGDSLVIAADTRLLAIDPQSGAEKRRTELGDEISAPIAVSEQGSIWALVGGDQVLLADPKTGEIKLRASDLPGVEWPVAPLQDQLVIAFRRSPSRRFLAYLDPAVKKGVKRLFPGGLPPVIAIPESSGSRRVLHTQDRPSAILARDAQGNVAWRSVQPKKIFGLSVAPLGDVVIAGVGSRALGLEPKKGAVLFDIELAPPGPERPPPKKVPTPPPALVKALAFGKDGGAAVLESGSVYGLAGLSDPRPRGWLSGARLELARAYLKIGQSALAVPVAKDILQRDPENLDALAILAALEEKMNPKQSAERWRLVAALAPKHDPLQARAAHALQALAGIAAWLELERPIDLALAGSDSVIVVRTDEAIIGLSANAPFSKLWSRPRAELLPLGDGNLRAGGEIISAKDGLTLSKLDPAGLFAANGVLVRVTSKDDAEELTRETPARETLWRVPIAGKGRRVLDADPHYALIASDQGAIDVLRMSTGERATTLTAGSVRRASISGSSILLVLDKTLTITDAQTGKPTFALPISDILDIEPLPQGWLLLSRQKLRLLDRRGRITAQIPLPSPIDHWAVTEVSNGKTSQIAFLALTDETLQAVDLTHGQLRGRLKLGRLLHLAPSGARALAVESSGALLILDATKALRP